MNEPTYHPGDDLEAYALGLLAPAEGAAIEAHVAHCDACVRRLGDAERTVTTMLAMAIPSPAFPAAQMHAPPPIGQSRFRRLTFAAAFVAAAVTGLLTVRIASLEQDVRGDGQLVQAMLASHFAHAQFRSPDGRALDAKVLYERRGGWYEVFASDPTWRVAIVPRAGDVPRLLDERFQRRGDAAILRVPSDTPLHALELRNAAGRTIGRVEVPQMRGR